AAPSSRMTRKPLWSRSPVGNTSSLRPAGPRTSLTSTSTTRNGTRGEGKPTQADAKASDFDAAVALTLRAGGLVAQQQPYDRDPRHSPGDARPRGRPLLPVHEGLNAVSGTRVAQSQTPIIRTPSCSWRRR